MAHASFLTALKLQAAGFPQPTRTPAAEQVWYNAINSSPYYITASEGERCDYVAGEVFYIDRYLNEGEVFAPTAEDILQKLPPRYCIFYLVPNVWACIVQDSLGQQIAQFRAPSAVEACASAYLSLFQS